MNFAKPLKPNSRRRTVPDISMCQDKECSKFKDCYRAQAKPNEHWQTYFSESPREESGECNHFWPMVDISIPAKKKRKEQND